MKLEVVVIPVSDVGRAKRFYGNGAGASMPTSSSATHFWSSSRLRLGVLDPLRHRAHNVPARQADFISWYPTSRRRAPTSLTASM